MDKSCNMNSANAKNIFYNHLGKYQGESTQDKNG